MAQWDQWLKHGSQQKEKFKSRHHDDFDDDMSHGKKAKNVKANARTDLSKRTATSVMTANCVDTFVVKIKKGNASALPFCCHLSPRRC
ncbi:hypothetical protein [Salinivibrio costicola]|uniref:hypothetical protein n=1 Tax=Salinivibrio costicola TaxID=51367 RepID=UPI000395C32A|nr:hypothetical protein [Salinivibrio costicola]